MKYKKTLVAGIATLALATLAVTQTKVTKPTPTPAVMFGSETNQPVETNKIHDGDVIYRAIQANITKDLEGNVKAVTVTAQAERGELYASGSYVLTNAELAQVEGNVVPKNAIEKALASARKQLDEKVLIVSEQPKETQETVDVTNDIDVVSVREKTADLVKQERIQKADELKRRWQALSVQIDSLNNQVDSLKQEEAELRK